MRGLLHVASGIGWILALGLLGCSSTSGTGQPSSAGSAGVGGASSGTTGGSSNGTTGGASNGTTGGSSNGTTGGAPGSGGKSGTGGATGTGGSGGAATVVVQPCDKLAQDGVWERIGPAVSFNSDASVVNVATDPLQAGTVYAGIGKSSSPQYGLWKSTDCGANWAHMNTGKNGTVLDSGSQWEIRVDPTNSDVYTLSAYGSGGFYRSTNGGVDWDDISPKGDGIPGFVQQFSIAPDDHRHIVVSFHANCGGAYAPMCLGETTDGAATWKFVKGPTGGWGEGAGPSVLAGSQWIYAAPFDGVYVTTDSGATWKKPIGYPGCTMDPVRVSGSWYIACLNMAVHASTDGNNWTSLDTSPQGSGLGLTGKYLYVAFQNDTSGQPIHRAALSALKTWTTVTTPKISQGPNAGGMPYDSHHRVLYVGAWGGGLWRVVTD